MGLAALKLCSTCSHFLAPQLSALPSNVGCCIPVESASSVCTTNHQWLYYRGDLWWTVPCCLPGTYTYCPPSNLDRAVTDSLCEGCQHVAQLLAANVHVDDGAGHLVAVGGLLQAQLLRRQLPDDAMRVSSERHKHSVAAVGCSKQLLGGSSIQIDDAAVCCTNSCSLRATIDPSSCSCSHRTSSRILRRVWASGCVSSICGCLTPQPTSFCTCITAASAAVIFQGLCLSTHHKAACIAGCTIVTCLWSCLLCRCLLTDCHCSHRSALRVP